MKFSIKFPAKYNLHLYTELSKRFSERCGPGLFSLGGLVPCSTCPEDTYQPDTGMTECMFCPPGTIAPPGSDRCDSKSSTLFYIITLHILL